MVIFFYVIGAKKTSQKTHDVITYHIDPDLVWPVRCCNLQGAPPSACIPAVALWRCGELSDASNDTGPPSEPSRTSLEDGSCCPAAGIFSTCELIAHTPRL